MDCGSKLPMQKAWAGKGAQEVRDFSQGVAVARSKPEPFLYESQKRFGTPQVSIVQKGNAGTAHRGWPPGQKLARVKRRKRYEAQSEFAYSGWNPRPSETANDGRTSEKGNRGEDLQMFNQNPYSSKKRRVRHPQGRSVA